MRSAIYLDHNATTPVEPRVLDAMLPFFSARCGNAASPHCFGMEARSAVEEARAQIASLVGARARDVIVTSGATEANNLAIRGLAEASVGRHQIVSCVTEHPSVLAPLDRVAKHGLTVDLC